MNTDEQYAIEVKNLTKSYALYHNALDRLKEALSLTGKKYHHKFDAVRDVSLEVRRGECLGVLGKNGSGKSTFLKMLAGVLTPSSGEISVRGKLSALLELGSGFNPELTGLDNIFFNAALLGLSRAETEEKLKAIIDFADIGDFIEQPVKTYSSGMTVRLAFAIAIHVEPEVLIVDEALSVGDIQFQAKCYQKIIDIKKRGMTILFVSHDLSAIVSFCDRAVILREGRLVASGSASMIVDEFRKQCSNDISAVTSTAIQAGADGLRGEQMWLPFSPAADSYGNGNATITKVGIVDSTGFLSVRLKSGDQITVKIQVVFHQSCLAPIITHGWKDLNGVELFGTNTWYAQKGLGQTVPGDCFTVSFSGRLPFRPGPLNLSVGCTELSDAGVIAHHRITNAITVDFYSEDRFTGLSNVLVDVLVEKNQ